MSAENQLSFLDQLQQLLIGSRFTATYKLSLLMALSDIAVEEPDEPAISGSISIRMLAEKICGLYWSHAIPYQSTASGTRSAVLIQSHLRQAEIVKLICAFHQAHGFSTHHDAARYLPNEYRALVSKLTKIVSAKPVRHLQVEGEEFLFTLESRGHIQLKEGVREGLRRFKPLIDHLCRNIWLAFIRELPANRPMIGHQDHLEAFLFAPARARLAAVRDHLLELDGSTCFYCDARSSVMEVDHFVPFSLYARDLVHNFVLACKQCNGKKSDQLACEPDLSKWLTRGTLLDDSLNKIANETGFDASWRTTLNVATWAYELKLAQGTVHAWSHKGITQTLTHECLSHLHNARLQAAS